MSSIDMDSLEVCSIVMNKSIWELFSALCKIQGINVKRAEALWHGWVQENFIPEWMEVELRLLIISNDKEGP